MNSAIILAGGLSVRMGFDKQLLTMDYLGDSSVLTNAGAGKVRLIDIMVSKLTPLFDEIIISTNKPFHYKDKYNNNCLILSDDIGIGPLAGIYQGLRHCKSQYLYVIACDMPFISIDYISYMKKLLQLKTVDACVTKRKDGFYEPFNAFYSKSSLKYIENAILNNNYGINRLLDKMNLLTIDEKTSGGFDSNMFFNANKKEDLSTLNTLMRGDYL